MTGSAQASRQSDVEFQRQLYVDRNPTRRQLHCDRRDWVLEQVFAYSRPGDRVLEVGVGCGIFTEELARQDRLVSAVDINPAFLENVRPLQAVAIHLKDATEPLGLGDHDLAICSEVLEHVPPDKSPAMLAALHDSLRPGGVLILTTPQRYSTVELGARLLRFKPMLALARRLYGSADELGHINLLTAGALGRQLRNAGFVPLQRRNFGFYLPGIAEFGGRPGARLLRAAERLLRPLPLLGGLLWTQGWVLQKSP
ncbi:MAG TPA: class I SAM-dependent methyltransferase [Sphingomicrobium sp.]|nr:class I SAM-dependent methyltransferase [Sphingomicrobium sp.]